MPTPKKVPERPDHAERLPDLEPTAAGQELGYRGPRFRGTTLGGRETSLRHDVRFGR